MRLDRAQPIPSADLQMWQAEIGQQFTSEIAVHFAAEENALFPAASRFPELVQLVEELTADHVSLREYFLQAESGRMSTEELAPFAQLLSRHIRKEERQLFERMQQLMNPKELASLGGQLEAALRDAANSCSLPNAATRLRSVK